MNEFYAKHYIATDDRSRITGGWSDGPCPDRDTTDAICINEQGGYQFRLAPGGEENPALRTIDGIPLYKWNGVKAAPRTEAEIAADRAATPDPPPDETTLLRAQVAMLQEQQTFLEDCLLEMAEEVYA